MAPLIAVQLVTTETAVMGGAPCLVGSRLPVQTLLDCVAAGDTWERIVSSWPWLTSEHLAAAHAWQAATVDFEPPRAGRLFTDDADKDLDP